MPRARSLSKGEEKFQNKTVPLDVDSDIDPGEASDDKPLAALDSGHQSNQGIRMRWME
jgi:hypothetical protein